MNVSGHLFIRGREAGWQHAGKQLFHDIPPFLSRILLIIKGRQRKGKYRICSETDFFAEGSLRCYDTEKKKTRRRELTMLFRLPGAA